MERGNHRLGGAGSCPGEREVERIHMGAWVWVGCGCVCYSDGDMVSDTL